MNVSLSDLHRALCNVRKPTVEGKTTTVSLPCGNVTLIAMSTGDGKLMWGLKL